MILSSSLTKDQIEKVKEYIKNNFDTEVEVHSTLTNAFCNEKVESSLKLAIELNDAFITKDQYEYCLEKATKDMVECSSSEIQDVVNLSYDVVNDILYQEGVI